MGKIDVPEEAYMVLDFYFQQLHDLWTQVITQNWLLSISVLLMFVSFGISVFLKTYKKEDK